MARGGANNKRQAIADTETPQPKKQMIKRASTRVLSPALYKQLQSTKAFQGKGELVEAVDRLYQTIRVSKGGPLQIEDATHAYNTYMANITTISTGEHTESLFNAFFELKKKTPKKKSSPVPPASKPRRTSTPSSSSHCTIDQSLSVEERMQEAWNEWFAGSLSKDLLRHIRSEAGVTIGRLLKVIEFMEHIAPRRKITSKTQFTKMIKDNEQRVLTYQQKHVKNYSARRQAISSLLRFFDLELASDRRSIVNAATTTATTTQDKKGEDADAAEDRDQAVADDN